jgi:hypothetical protein
LRRGVWNRGRLGIRFSSAIFQVNVVSHSVEVKSGVANISLCYLLNSANNTIDGLVGQIFRTGTPSTGKDLDQSPPNVFVFLTGTVHIRIEPNQEP